ncbi:hypothetical protein EAMG_05363 [Escherichia coli M056]|nr:hypothetical protein [Escherichia coli]OSK25435.1 hypothetical protein EAMG_05363 [Escherichia coli M056]
MCCINFSELINEIDARMLRMHVRDATERQVYEIARTALTVPPVAVIDAKNMKVLGEDGSAYVWQVEYYDVDTDTLLYPGLPRVEPVSHADKLTFEQWLEQQHGKIDVDCGCVSTETLMHWMRVAYEAGKHQESSQEVNQ